MRVICTEVHMIMVGDGDFQWCLLQRETLEKRRLERQAERKVSRCWNKCLIHSKIHWTYPPNETLLGKTKGRVWNLIQWQELWIHLTKFDATTRKLNRQHNIQLAVTKTLFFQWYVATECDTHNENSIFCVDSASYPISFVLHACITYDIKMALLWLMDVSKGRYQFISFSWDFVSMVTPGLFQILASIWI